METLLNKLGRLLRCLVTCAVLMAGCGDEGDEGDEGGATPVDDREDSGIDSGILARDSGSVTESTCAAGTWDDDRDPSTVCTACAAGEFCSGGAAPVVTCAVGSWDDDGDPATGCRACVAGEFCSGGAAPVVTCAVGAWDDDGDPATGCRACVAGEFCAGGSAPVVTCAARTWDDDGDPATACRACIAGQFCLGGNATAQTCAAGTWDDDGDSATACTGCAAGTWDDDRDPTTVCTVCAAGEFCAGGSAPAMSCAAGTWDDDRDSRTGCRACVVGEFCSGGATALTCAAGTWDDDRDPATRCGACAVGEFCAGGSGVLASCAAGTWDDDSDPATACTACITGEFCAGGATVLASCAAGTWDDDSDPATACSACAPGEFCAGGAAVLASCAAGTWDADGDPATACKACVAGEFCAGGPAPAMSCAAGTWDADGDPVTGCTACVTGEFCAGGPAPAMSCAAGTWDADGDPVTACTACVAGEFCAGGAAPAMSCAAGTWDPDSDPATACVPIASCNNTPFYDATRYGMMSDFDELPLYIDDLSAHRGCCNTGLAYAPAELPNFPCAAKRYQVDEDATKPVVLLIHGNSDGPTTFEEFESTGPMLSEQLVAAGFRVYAVDMRYLRVDDPVDENTPQQMDHSWGVPLVQRFIRSAIEAHPTRRFALVAHSFGVSVARDALRRLQLEDQFNAWPYFDDIIYAAGANHGIGSCAWGYCGGISMKGTVVCQLGCRSGYTPTAFMAELNGINGAHETPCAASGEAFGDASACDGNQIDYTTITMQDMPNGTQQDLFVSEASSALLGADNQLIGLDDFDPTNYYANGVIKNHFGAVRSAAGIALIMNALNGN